MRRIALGLLMFTLAMPAAAVPAAAKMMHIVASFTIIADMIRQVGGDHVDVVSLVHWNGDPHAYEPSPDDAKRLRDADIVFVNGMGLEGWMDRLISASGYKGKPVFTANGMSVLKMEENGQSIVDPHAWNSAANGIIYVRNIIEALSAADPEDAQDFKTSGEKYIKDLEALDAYAHQEIDAIPLAKRKVITTHDAFGYFSRDYGVMFLSPVGLSTETEASAATVAKLIKQIKAEHVHAYFFENSNDPRLVQQIAKATGAVPGGELYVEALSPPDGPANTYAQMFRYNVDQLVRAMKN
ncbi:metal ABC transporter substrate-binding protein [Methyloferula stellata]|uniref:metal ABC transporter substrate-binding protein n=1 Tax=Methyloferula stellata TaxID=876270 RepID=UPI00047D9D4F|nr:metal ABC transporter substrate-binding protein [Methyloferula stellata]